MGNFDWKIWFTKLGKGILKTAAVGGIVYTLDYVGTTDFPPEYAVYGTVAYLVLEQVLNYIKHKWIVE